MNNYIGIATGVIGGLGLFIYGIHLLSDSLKKLSLGFLKTILEKMTSNRIKAMFAGVFVTSVIQSSSATSVILIGLLNAGIIVLAQAIPVIFGANIGTTITAQLIAFKLTKSALFFVFVGAVVSLFAKKDKHKNKGLALLGFGLLFLGLATMSDAVKPLAGNDSVLNLFVIFGKQPVLGILTGFLVTVVLQSSSTTIGMVIALASVGLLDLPSSVYLVMGDNIGTSITGHLASIGGRSASKKLAWSHTLFNVIGTLIVLSFVPLYLHYIPIFSSDIARQIANFHTIFNVVNVIILLSFVPLFVKVLNKFIPGEDYEKKEAKYLDKNLLTAPHLAIQAVITEMVAMLGICMEMLDRAKKCTITYNHKLKNEITIDEESVDEMQKNITEYLVEITRTGLTEKQSRLIPAILHSVNDLEKAGDYCEGIVILAQRAYEHNLTYSAQAKMELEKLFEKTETLMRQTKKALQYDDQKAASITLNIEEEIDVLIGEYKLNHIKRLEEGVCISNSGLIFTDILTNIERLNNHLCNITKGILHVGKR